MVLSVCLITLQEEFLLNGPTDVMGMFVTSEGTSQRAPLSWSERLLALGYSFPYAIALGASSISVHRYHNVVQVAFLLHSRLKINYNEV